MRTSGILVVAAFAAALGMGMYEKHRVARLSVQAQAFEQQLAGFPVKMRQLEQECAQVVQQNAALEEENRLLNRNPDEVLKLRAELSRLRAGSQELAPLKALERDQGKHPNDLTPRTPKVWLARVDTLKTWIAAHPEEQIPEFQYLQERNWLDVVKNYNYYNLRAETGLRSAAHMVRARAKEAFGDLMSVALRNFVSEHNGDLPNDLRQLNPYLSPPLTDNLLNAYKLLYSGKDADVPKDKWPIVEIRPPQDWDDSHLVIGTRMWNRSRK